MAVADGGQADGVEVWGGGRRRRVSRTSTERARREGDDVQMSGRKPSNSATSETVAALTAGPTHCAETAAAPMRPAMRDLSVRPIVLECCPWGQGVLLVVVVMCELEGGRSRDSTTGRRPYIPASWAADGISSSPRSLPVVIVHALPLYIPSITHACERARVRVYVTPPLAAPKLPLPAEAKPSPATSQPPR